MDEKLEQLLVVLMGYYLVAMKGTMTVEKLVEWKVGPMENE